MAVQLNQVVPFGRSHDEYCKMFNLTEHNLAQRILGVGDGPASFNAEATRLGTRVVSVDPIYELSGREISERFYQVVDSIIEQVRATPEDWVWSYHRSPDDLKRNRLRTLELFLNDYEQGKRENRYQIEQLPKLSFLDQAFDVALCSHLLFLYSDKLDLTFHVESILEMLRVACEVRIYPLLTLAIERSPHLAPVIDELQKSGYEVSIERSQYELQRGGNEMLRVRRKPL